MAVWDLAKKKAFLIYQVARLENVDKSRLKNVNIRDLEIREKKAYYKKHPSLEGAPEYKPSTY